MNSQSTVRLVIGVLGLLALAVVVGGIFLALDDKSLPGELIAIGSAAAGAVGSILSRAGNATDPQPVVGIAGGPVLTTEASPPAATRARKATKKAAGEKGASDIAVIVVGVLLVILVLILVGRI